MNRAALIDAAHCFIIRPPGVVGGIEEGWMDYYRIAPVMEPGRPSCR